MKSGYVAAKIRASRNPAAQAGKTFAADAKFLLKGEWLRLVVADLADTKDSFIAMIEVEKERDGRWVAQTAAARTGYGPLLYEMASHLIGESIYPSEDQSKTAKDFWAKQVGVCIAPIKSAEFQRKYGLSPAQLLENGKQMSHELIEDLIVLGERKAIAGQKAGK